MIHIVGPKESREYGAAVELCELLIRAWPRIGESQEDSVYIVVAAKCHGQQVRDIDLLLLASFGADFKYSPFLSVTDRNGQPTRPPLIDVQSLCAVIEVKDHSAQGVRFIGSSVEVAYGYDWKNASEQVERQMYSVQNYLKQVGIARPPIVTPLIWLRNVSNTDLPRRPHNIIGAELTGELLLNVIGQNGRVQFINGQWTLDPIGSNPLDIARLADIFTKEVQPTRLDRLRMERLNQRGAETEELEAVLRKKLLVLRGRGGTGKTMRLLQLAKRLLDEEDARVLILTYNKALVADIRRLLTIMNIGDSLADRAIQIQTVHSFLHSALRSLDVLDVLSEDYTDFLMDYERLKDEAVAYLRSGVVSPEDIAAKSAAHDQAFAWDYVFVDEGQDWPLNERDLLLALYPPAHVAVAHGREQLVRGLTTTNWREGVPQGQAEVVTLKQTLRMKAGLARFVTSVAKHLGAQNTEWEANSDLPGGQVLIIDGPYLYDRRLHDNLVTRNSADLNSPVDMLFCLPPTLVVHNQGDGETRSVAATVFSQWGYKTWDGASEDVREGYPTELDQLRIVQYESCRGLEGWTVVNLSLDRFYDLKLAEGGLQHESSSATPGVFRGDPMQAQSWATQWTLIPLTRAIDTLVIQLDGLQSPLRAALRAAANEHSDVVKWLKSEERP